MFPAIIKIALAGAFLFAMIAISYALAKEALKGKE